MFKAIKSLLLLYALRKGAFAFPILESLKYASK
jgi:hypothetical protein